MESRPRAEQVQFFCRDLLEASLLLFLMETSACSLATWKMNGIQRVAHHDGSRSVLVLMPRLKQVLSERKAERRLLGALRSQVVSRKTDSRYLEHVSRFLQFLKERPWKIISSNAHLS